MNLSNEVAYIKEYFKKKPIFKSLIDEVIYILEDKLQTNDIQYSSINGRVKSIESFFDKIRDRKKFCVSYQK